MRFFDVLKEFFVKELSHLLQGLFVGTCFSGNLKLFGRKKVKIDGTAYS